MLAGDLVPRGWRRWRPVAELATLAATARAVLLSRSPGVRVNAVSLGAHVAGAVALYVVARDMGLPLYLRDCLVLVPLVMLASAVPISIAGWGVREGVMVAALSALGVGTEPALVLSLVLGVVALFHGLIGAVPLAFGPVKLDAVRRAALRSGGAGTADAAEMVDARVLAAP